MVLLRTLSDDAIVDNLRKRLAAKAIFVSFNKFDNLTFLFLDLYWASVDQRQSI
jgi:hypothetical protein